MSQDKPNFEAHQRSQDKPDFEAHQRIKETAAIYIADLWVACSTAFGSVPPPAVAIFGRALDRLITTALAHGLDGQDLIAELDTALHWARSRNIIDNE